jgi:transcriptional regulator with XRE-family HTH domain
MILFGIMKQSSDSMLAMLRRALRAQGWTVRRIAAEFGIGEATAKRWLAGKALTLDRLERLAGLVGLSLADLARDASPAQPLSQELTLAQERALLEDNFLSFLFMTILGGHGPDEVARDFNIPPRSMEQALLRLERLALIDRLHGGRVRPLVDRTVIWRKSPMRTAFETQVKPQFLAMDFAASDAVYASEMVKLSAQGAATLAEMIERHRRDVQELAQRDRQTAQLPGSWYIMLCAARPMDVSGLRDVV